MSQIAKFMGPTYGPPESCQPQMGPMLAQWTLLSGSVSKMGPQKAPDCFLLVMMYCGPEHTESQPGCHQVCHTMGVAHKAAIDSVTCSAHRSALLLQRQEPTHNSETFEKIDPHTAMKPADCWLLGLCFNIKKPSSYGNSHLENKTDMRLSYFCNRKKTATLY